MRRVLEIPLHLAGIDVEGHDAICIEVVAFADVAHEIDAGLTRAPIKRVQLRIEAADIPDRTATQFPRITFPTLNSFLTRLGDYIPRPSNLAGVGVEGLYPAAAST